MGDRLKWVGKSLPRKDAVGKVTGEVRFVADMQLTGMLHAKFLRSPHAHARVISADTSRAKALPGVKAIVTHEDVPKIHCSGRKFGYPLNEVVCYAGEEVAAVAAETKEIAEHALTLMEVKYEVLPAVFDSEEAMGRHAPVVHAEYSTNVYSGLDADPIPRIEPQGWLSTEFGDIGKGFAGADFVIEGEYESPVQALCSPLPCAVICEWNGYDLTCWTDTQVAWFVAKDLAKCLGIPLSSARVIASTTVGGYGGKAPDRIAVLTALLARKTHRPVKAIFSRAEEFVGVRHRPSYKAYGKIGVSRAGDIVAMHHKMIGNCGSDPPWGLEIMSASVAATGSTLYPCPNSRFEGCMVMTDTVDASPMMGMGDLEAGFCVERLIDEAAEAIGMDPVAFRIKNCARYGTRAATRRDVLGLSHDQLDHRPGPLECGIVGRDFRLQECITKAAEAALWQQKWKGWGVPVEVRGSKNRGIGIGLGMHMSEYRFFSATVKMNQDGTAVVMSSAAEQGQGIRTAMAQVVAETLGIDYDDVNVVLADTAVAPEGWGTTASGGTSSAIAAAKHAADDAKKKLFTTVATRLGAEVQDLVAMDGRIYVDGQPEKGIPVSVACLLGFQITGTAVNPDPDSIIDEETGKVIKSYSCGATVAEVEVDMQTGAVDVLKLFSAHDCGIAINPTVLAGQVDLGLNIGSGCVLSEEFVVDKRDGVMLNPSLLDYKIMTMLDMPKSEDIKEIIVESPSAWGPYGAKGCSETPAASPPAAIANAVYNAIGVRLRGDHLTPERIIQALADARKSNSGC